ncbi:MAG: hypothetical protein N2169_04595, partial [bacterium]|nr:hypothetical protein [bacterium]
MDYYTTYYVYSSPERSNILDRNGFKIAYSKETINIVLHKSRYNMLNFEQKNYVKNFVLQNLKVSNIDELLKKIYIDKIVIEKDPDYRDICLLMENMMYLYGVDVYVDYRRFYDGPAFAFVCGFVDIPYKEDVLKDESLQYYSELGKYGLEFWYDEILRGQLGKIKYLMDPSGHPIKIIEETLPKRGNDLITTIDKNVQIFAHKGLKELCDALSLKNMQPVGGSVIVMKVNGEIIALLSYPSFYPDSLKPDDNGVIRSY